MRSRSHRPSPPKRPPLADARMPKRLLSTVTPAVLALALGATACTANVDAGDSASGDSTTGETTGASTGATASVVDLSSDEILLTSGLQTVDDCDALLGRITDEAMERVGPYGFDGHQVVFLEGDARDFATDDEATEAAATATTTAAGRSGQLASSEDAAASFSAAADTVDGTSAGSGLDRGPDYSGTNNQERDVDEADLVKTDGERLVVVSGPTVRVIDVTGRTPQLVSTIELPDDVWGGELFLDGDRALLMTSGWTEQPFFERGVSVDWYPGSSVGVLHELDIDRGEIVRTLEFEGSYLSARRIGDTVRIVLTASAQRFAFVYPSNDNALEAAERANRSLLAESTIDQWIPTYRITERGEVVDQGRIVDCDRVHLPTEFAGFGSVIIMTTDLDDGLRIEDTVSVFTDASTVYASTDQVAVATPRWPQPGELDGLDPDAPAEDGYRTAIHTFDITDPSSARYTASGVVPGHLLNQYSMSEHDGYLRVATTIGNPWFGAEERSESVVTVLGPDDGVLREVGSVGGLGRGEQIFAVRFLGDVGYVVTFRQIDPLYTIDLSDPTDPRLLGELKIPGFSSYLHPIDDRHLLGVGTDGDEEGRTFGPAVSVFDVSDLSNPTLVSKLPLYDQDDPFGGASTPVSWDARAFTYFDETALVPITWFSYDEETGSEGQGSGVVAIDVDDDGNLIELGRVSTPAVRQCESGIYAEPLPVPLDDDATTDTTEPSGDAEASFVDPETSTTAPPSQELIAPRPDEWCWVYAPEVNRTVVVGQDLFSVTPGGVLVSDFASFDTIAWIPFDEPWID